MQRIIINPKRYLRDLNALRQIGQVGKGVVRPAFSPTDVQARRWLAQRMVAAGLQTKFDQMGNLFGMPPTRQRPILLGSHSDTQPEGGWLDGAFGVIAGLEVARASLAGDGPPVAVVSFQEEEGRFGGVVTGSQVWTGALTQRAADRLTDTAGRTLGDCRRAAGLPTGAKVAPDRFVAFIEPHIEQGIRLIDAGQQIGVVDSIVGIRQVLVTLVGEQNHAGTTPMGRRRDAFVGLTQIRQRLSRQLEKWLDDATVWTIGHVELHPNASSIVPGRVQFTVQWRSASRQVLRKIEQQLMQAIRTVAAEHGFKYTLSERRQIEPTKMHGGLVQCVADAAASCVGGRWSRMTSGALHDAASVAKRMPAAMLFVPSIGGVSHSFEEDTAPEDLVAGAEVLAEAVNRYFKCP